MGLILFIGVVILMLSLIPTSGCKVERKSYTRSSRSKVLPWLDKKRRKKHSR